MGFPPISLFNLFHATSEMFRSQVVFLHPVSFGKSLLFCFAPHLWVCTFECSLLIGHVSFLVVPSSKILTPMQSLFPLRRSNKPVDKVMSLDTIMMEGNNWKMMMLKQLRRRSRLGFGTAFHNRSFAVAGYLPQDNYQSEGIACLTALRPTILKKYHFIEVSQMFTPMLP